MPIIDVTKILLMGLFHNNSSNLFPNVLKNVLCGYINQIADFFAHATQCYARNFSQKLFTEKIIWWHEDVTAGKRFPYYWPFVRGIHLTPMASLPKGWIIQSFGVFFVVSNAELLNKRSSSRLFKIPYLLFYCKGSFCVCTHPMGDNVTL